MVIFRRSFLIDFLRTLIRSKMRFLSILAIIALGVGFYAGINATEPDMILSADNYYQEQNLADFRVISPLGLNDDDIRRIEELPGIAQVQPGYAQDLYLVTEEGSQSTVRLISLPPDNGREAINDLLLLSGRLPRTNSEIVIDHIASVPEAAVIGSSLRVAMPAGKSSADVLSVSEFTIVGVVMSPLYVNIERGQTSIGDGSVDYYAYIPHSAFVLDDYSEVSLRSVESSSLSAYTDEYSMHLEPLGLLLNELGEELIAADTAAMREEINKNRSELQDRKNLAEAELADAEKQLAEAENEILLGEQELLDMEEKYEQEIEEGYLELEAGRSDLIDGRSQYFSSYGLWLEAYNQYQDGREELNLARVELENARYRIEEAERELDAAAEDLAAAESQLSQLRQTIDTLEDLQLALTEGSTADPDEISGIIEEIRVFSPELAAALEVYLEDPEADTSLLVPLLAAVRDLLEQEYTTAAAEYDAGLAEYNDGRDRLAASKAEYETGLAEYNAGVRELEKGKAEIDQGRQELAAALEEIESGQAGISAGEAELEQAKKDLDEELARGKSELAAAREELAAAQEEFAEEEQSFRDEIAKAEAEIRNAERQLLEIPQQWFVLTRDDNPGYADYGSDARRIGAVAKIFPLFFFLVAALVCFTTMTRMIEEERIQIGTMKALGYSTMTISSKYLAYALAASLIGSILGLLLGFSTFPRTIMNAYALLYQIPGMQAPFHLNYAAFSVFVALLTVALAMMASIQELRATPAVLMHPPAPKPGKRILLERIDYLWKRLSFSNKLAARNIFRYKQRLMMTVIGIAGCTALLLTGFGLKDSINAIIGKQFDEIFVYDAQLMIDTEQDEAEDKMQRLLEDDQNITEYQIAHMESISIMPYTAGSTYEATLLVAGDPQNLHNFIDLHERISRKPLPLAGDGAIITEKLADLIQADAGDSIVFRDADNRTYTIRISAIAENYLTHYVYMSPDYFDQVTLRTPVFNSAVFNLADPENIDQSAFQENLLDNDIVLGSIFTLEISDEFSNTLGSLNYVVLILIISAGALAFVVLYNLININITERIREIATIKVLGFRDREVSIYVFREIIVLTLIGTIMGLLLGVALHRFVMDTMEVDNMMFGKGIQLLSFVFSVLLTLLFSVLVNVMMHFRLRRIKLADSLKSVD